MKTLSVGRSNQTIAILIFMAASVLPIYSQEAQPSEKAPAVQSGEEQAGEIIYTKSPGETSSARQVDSIQPRANPPTGEGYTFPTKRERFKRYVKSTVGPVSIARTAISAGIDQWQD